MENNFSFLRDNKEFIFNSFIYNNQSLAYTMFDFLIDNYNKRENEFLKKNDITLLFSEEKFEITSNDFDNIVKKSFFNKEKYFSINYAQYSFNKDITFKDFTKHMEYLINEKESSRYKIVLNKDKLKKFIRDKLNGFSLENPVELSDNLKSKIKNIMNRKIYKYDLDNIEQEISLLDFFQTDKISLDEIDTKVYSEQMKYIKENYKNLIVNDKALYNYSKNLIEEFQNILLELPFITEALSIKTMKVLSLSNEFTDIKIKKNIIRNYLNNSMKTIEKFYQKNNRNTIKGYIERIHRLIKLIETYFYYSDKTNINFELLSIKWNEIFNNYSIKNDELYYTIKNIITSLKEKEEILKFEEKANYIFEDFIFNQTFDRQSKTPEKRENFNQWLSGEVNCDISDIVFSKTNAGKIFKNKTISDYKLIDNLRELLNVNNIEKLYTDEEFKLIKDNLIKEEEEKISLLNKELEYKNNFNLKLEVVLNKLIPMIENIDSLSPEDLINKLKEKYRTKEFEEILEIEFKNLYNNRSIINDRELFKIKEMIFKKYIQR